ncbi:MAG TPA: response regulator [Anaerolineales bacterium]
MNQEGRVLVVDDEPFIRMNLRALLEDLGFVISEAANGREALEVFDREAPELVLADLRMPEMDGLTLITALRQKAPDTPIIVVSGTGSIHEAMEAVRRGALDYITKPVVDQEEFIITIERTLERARLITENRRYREHLEELVAARTAKLHEQAMMLEQEISERQRAQEELELKQRQLQELNATLEQRVCEEVEKNREKDRIMSHQARLAAMGEMLSNIAHQWRQPLNNLGLIIQNLQEDYSAHVLDEEGLREYVASGMDTLRYMSRTISDFQHYFRPNREPSRFDIATTIRETVRLVEPSLHAAGISVRLHDAETYCVSGFANEFAQVILNIINNAKDTLVERNIPNPVIDITSCCRDDGIMVSIRDNGGGIPVDVMDKIFDPYFTTKAKTQGTGLGLYMAKMIIGKGMGGKLTARNTPEGAEFLLEIARNGTDARQ